MQNFVKFNVNKTLHACGFAGEDMGRKVVPVIKPAERVVHDSLVPAADGDASSEVSTRALASMSDGNCCRC